MKATKLGYKNILVATDFSPASGTAKRSLSHSPLYGKLRALS